MFKHTLMAAALAFGATSVAAPALAQDGNLLNQQGGLVNVNVQDVTAA
jgi:hypothetical protein